MQVGEPGVAPRPPSQSGDSVVSTHEGATGAADTLSGGPQPMQHDGGRSTSPFRETDAMEVEVHHPLYVDIGSPMHITTPLGSSPESTTLERFGSREAPPQPFGSVMSLVPERGLLGGLQSMRSVGSSAGNPLQTADSELSRWTCVLSSVLLTVAQSFKVLSLSRPVAASNPCFPEGVCGCMSSLSSTL